MLSEHTFSVQITRRRVSSSLQVNASDTETLARMVELWFIFSLIWSICASVDEDGRKRMDGFLREKHGTFPIKVPAVLLTSSPVHVSATHL